MYDGERRIRQVATDLVVSLARSFPGGNSRKNVRLAEALAFGKLLVSMITSKGAGGYTQTRPGESLAMPRNNALGRGSRRLIREPEALQLRHNNQKSSGHGHGAATQILRASSSHPRPQQIDIDLIEL